MRTFKSSLLAFFLLAASAFGQGVFYSNVAISPSGKPIPAPTVAVCTYPANTNTTPCSPLASIYQNQALTTPQTNPTTGDNYGNYGFWAYPAHYVIQVYGGGISTFTYDLNESHDPMSGNPIYDVRSFGAAGNGTTDDTAAIQAAFTAANASCGIVQFVPGVYKTSSTVTFNQICVSIRGTGKDGAAVIDYTGSSGAAIEYNGTSFTTARASYIKDFAVACGASSPTSTTQAGPSATTVGLLLYSEIGRLFQDVAVGGCGDGIQLYQTPNNFTEESEFQHISLLRNFYGLHLNGVNGGSGDSYSYTKFEGYCENYSNQGGACIRVDDGWFYHSSVDLRVNELAQSQYLSADVIQSGPLGKIEDDDIRVYGEGATGNPVLAEDPQGSYALSGIPDSLMSQVFGALPYMPSGNATVAWAATHSYSVGNYIQPSGCNSGYGYMMVATAGTSGASQPTWNCSTLDQNTTDGGVTWRFVGAYPGAVGGISNAIVGPLVNVASSLAYFTGQQGYPNPPSYAGEIYSNATVNGQGLGVVGGATPSIASSSGWGTGASVGFSANPQYTGLFELAITVGTSPSANPIVMVNLGKTFSSDPYAFVSVLATAGNSFSGSAGCTTSTCTIQFVGTPTASDTYYIQVLVLATS